MTIEFRSINPDDAEVRAEGDGMTFTGYAIRYGVPSQPLPFTEVIAPGDIEWHCEGTCTDAVTIFTHEVARDRFAEMRADAHARRMGALMLAELEKAKIHIEGDAIIVRTRPRKIGMKLSIFVRCRKCEKCLRARAMLWACRATNEIDSATRTWFGTLTLRPSSHHHFVNMARIKGDRSHNDFDALDDAALKEVQLVRGDVLHRLDRFALVVAASHLDVERVERFERV